MFSSVHLPPYHSRCSSGPGLTLMQHMAHGRTASLPPSLSHMKARVVGVRLFILQLLHDVSLLPILESFSNVSCHKATRTFLVLMPLCMWQEYTKFKRKAFKCRAQPPNVLVQGLSGLFLCLEVIWCGIWLVVTRP